MSELTLTVIKLGFLAVLWLFVLSAVSAMRTDVFGVKPARQPAQPQDRPQKAPKPPRNGRNAPSRLVVVDGPDKDRWAELGEAPVTIGRGPDCTLALSDEYVSTRHARVLRHDGQWYVEDLGSTNGTHLGTQRLTRATPVGTKAQIRLGRTVLELRK